jgi:microcystin-dependent protein
MMSQPFVGQVIRVGFNFAPSGWMQCQGQLLPIDQFSTLFNLIGTTYGGDGQSTFALPDLQGRVPNSMGQSSNTSNYVIGQKAGTQTVTLTGQQMPQHQHFVNVLGSAGNNNVPGNQSLLANEGPQGITQVFTYAPYDAANQTALSGSAIGPNQGGQPHENRQPFLAIRYCISMFGVYPSPN